MKLFASAAFAAALLFLSPAMASAADCTPYGAGDCTPHGEVGTPIQASRPAAPVHRDAPTHLPFTGGDIVGLVLVGLAFAGGGYGIWLASRDWSRTETM